MKTYGNPVRLCEDSLKCQLAVCKILISNTNNNDTFFIV